MGSWMYNARANLSKLFLYTLEWERIYTLLFSHIMIYVR